MSLLLALVRAKVEMERVGREAAIGAAGGTLSGDSETECMVEAVDVCLLWLLEALRRLVLRVLRSCRPSSPTLLAMLWRAAWARVGGGVLEMLGWVRVRGLVVSTGGVVG